MGYDSTAGGNKGLGRRTAMTNASGSASWVYDLRGRTTQETKVISGTGGGTFVTQWSYDSADRPLWQKYPGGNASQVGEQVMFTYNAQGLLRQVQSNGSTYYVGETLCNALGQVTERRLGSTSGVVKQLYGYTAAENFRLVSLQADVSLTYTNLQNISYGYDDVGNVLTITDAAAYDGDATPAMETQNFTYDPLHRLKTAQAGGLAGYGGYNQKNYDYDASGNLTHFESATQNQYYQDAAHKHAVTHSSGTAAGNQQYWYDANGNATKRITDATYELAYDAENRLTEIKKNGAVSGTYVYDGAGVRVKETTGSTTTVYIGDYFEWTGSTATMKSYYYAGGTRVALRTGTSTGTVNYLLTDHLGSTALTLDANGNRRNTNTELRYYPYGATRYNTANQLTTYRPSTALRMYFTGQRTVVGTGGLYFYNARWYDPVVGRFLQADSIVPSPGDPQSLNRYAYVLNNPLKYRDPTGHWVESAFDVISLGLTLNDIRNEGFTFWNAVSLVTDVASVALPIVPAGASHVIRAGKLANKAVNAADSVSDAVKLVNSADAAANTARFINGADNAGDAFRPLSNLPDGEILYQFSRKPQDGNFQGFPDTLRTKQGETGMSCQIASLCGHDPVQGFKQQMEGQKPRPGDWVRETTVGDVKQWGGRVEYDGFPGNPWNYPPGHGTISSTGGKWGKPFDRIWRNARPIAE